MLDGVYSYREEAPTLEPLYICSNCGNGIFEEEYYWNADGGKLCEECMEEMRKVAELG